MLSFPMGLLASLWSQQSLLWLTGHLLIQRKLLWCLFICSSDAGGFVSRWGAFWGSDWLTSAAEQGSSVPWFMLSWTHHTVPSVTCNMTIFTEIPTSALLMTTVSVFPGDEWDPEVRKSHLGLACPESMQCSSCHIAQRGPTPGP